MLRSPLAAPPSGCSIAAEALIQLRASKTIARWLGVARMPSAKEMAIVSENANPAALRDCLGDILGKLRPLAR